MGLQISHVGDENCDAERETRASVVEAEYSYLSSRIERLVKRVQSRLATGVHGQSASPRESTVRQQLLQEGVSLTSPAEIAACNILPLHFTNISAVDVGCDTDECEMGVAVPSVYVTPVGLCCNVPLKRIRNVDTCNTGCQSLHDSHCSSTKTHDISQHLLTETSSAKCEMLIARSSKVDTIENGVDELKVCDLSRCDVSMDATSRFDNTEGRSRRRPPWSPKLITTSAHLAHETRPPEIGSYLAVAPVVSSCDLGLSPIDETAEVMSSTALLCPANASDINNIRNLQTPAELSNCNFSSDVFSSGYDCTMLQPSVYIVLNSEISQLENSAALSFDNNTNVVPLKADSIPQSDEGFVNGENNINVTLLPCKNDVHDERKFSEDACHCLVNTCCYSANGKNDETDKCQGRGVRNAVRVGRTLPADCGVFSDTEVTDCVKSKSFSCTADKRHFLDNRSSATSPYPVFRSEDSSMCSLQTSTPCHVLADTWNLPDNKALCVKASSRTSELYVPDTEDIETSASDSVWTEWETALSCCDWSTNNNESGKPLVARVSLSPATGPMVARRQVRHSSDGSSPLSSNVSAGEHLSTCNGQNLCRPTSQSSLDDVIVSPRTVPNHLDFQQVEKFEGR